jgi:hypothetical protein
LVAARQVSEGPLAWTDPVRPQGAFPEERPAGPGQHLDQDARGEIVQVVLSAVAQRASVRQSQDPKKPLPGASRRAQTVVPEPLLEWSTGELEAQVVAQLVPQTAARQAELQPELSWRLAHLAVALAQPEPVQAERCWPRVFLLERPAQLQ